MSKSLGNYVGINERPEDIFGKLMSVSDTMMWRYFELLTRIPPAEIATLRAAHPMDAKKRLARAITAQYHGDGAATEAEVRLGLAFLGAGADRAARWKQYAHVLLAANAMKGGMEILRRAGLIGIAARRSAACRPATWALCVARWTAWRSSTVTSIPRSRN